jgi:Zn ribbon nucleic-acid-binding protein|tara:strand:- start:370 stop:825 length:456 start_codon:yes stop_codon:yes gene_type:complete
MAEKKVTCPNCTNTDKCFEEQIDIENFSSFMCFNCGFTSNTAYKNDSKALEMMNESATQLMRDISIYDYDRKIHWFPSVLNMGKFGVIYPEGTKDNWSWRFADVRKLSEEEQKDPQYEGNEFTLDIENARTYGQHEFLDACKAMGIVKDIN